MLATSLHTSQKNKSSGSNSNNILLNATNRDLNEGRSIWRKRLFLKDIMDNIGGFDLEYTGRRHTWGNNHDGLGSIREWLNRVVASDTWVEAQPEASISHLRTEISDHSPILLTTTHKIINLHRPFKFFQAWTSRNSCETVISKAWNSDQLGGMHCHRMNKTLQNTSKALKRWNRETFGYAHVKRKELELETLEKSESNTGKQN